MATFIDLTGASTLQTPTRKLSQPINEVSGLSSSIQASRSYHYPLFQQGQRGVIDDHKEIDRSIGDDGRVYPLSIAPTTKRRPGVASISGRSLIEPSPTPSKLSQSTYVHSEDEVQKLNETPTRSRGQSSLQSTLSSRCLEVPFTRLAISAPSPSVKRRRMGLHWSSISSHKMTLPAGPHFRTELRDAEREENIIDLTITDNFPTWNHSKPILKRGILDLSGDSDSSDKNGEATQGTSHPSGSIDTAVNLRATEVSRRLAAAGVRRRIVALGLAAKIDPQGIIDLSAESDSGEEVEDESEVSQEPFRRPSVIGPEDYLSDDKISELLANLDIGPSRKAYRTPKPTPNRTQIEEFSHGSSRYKAGKSVELQDGTFLRIVSVLKDDKDEVFLSGHLLSRQNSCGTLMPKMRNELVWIVEMSIADFEAGCKPIPTEVRLTEAVGIRSVTFTNHQYPEMSLKTHKNGGFKSVREELSAGPLFCRWKSTRVIGERKQTYEDSIVHLSYVEADPKLKARIRPGTVRDMWRGSETVLGGSYITTRKSSINLVSACSDSALEQIQQYTFGDAFCGAGGCSTGASQAGLRINWGFDKDKHAIAVYAANLGRREGVESLNEPVHEFCGRADIDRFLVDILHISPPCQPFSPAHTVPSEIQDGINQAALFSVWHLVEKIKPRVATIEETEGLVNRHVEWFNALINIFVSQGYSVRWKVVRCQDYGVPQQRKRLFILAAG
jgi:DNA (cytosine-5)-methyltransferase 1